MVTLDQAGRHPGIAVSERIGAAAREFVQSIAVIVAEPARAPGMPWRIVADHAPHIVLSSVGRAHQVRVVGARQVFADIDNSQRTLSVVVRLHPGSLPRLLGLPASELTDSACALDSLHAPSLRDPLVRFEDSIERAPIEAMIAFLDEISSTSAPIDSRVRAFVRLANCERRDIATIASDIGMSVRGLRDLIWREVGISPKRVMRVRRLHRALSFGLGVPRVSGARAAFEAGYSDQSHFTRECTALLGESPGVFALRRF
jgi:AraC-like DNA-binding protein